MQHNILSRLENIPLDFIPIKRFSTMSILPTPCFPLGRKTREHIINKNIVSCYLQWLSNTTNLKNVATLHQRQHSNVCLLWTGLTPSHVWACSKPVTAFQSANVMVIFVFNGLRWDVIVLFVDIGGIVEHLCLSYLFIIYIIWELQYAGLLISGLYFSSLI